MNKVHWLAATALMSTCGVANSVTLTNLLPNGDFGNASQIAGWTTPRPGTIAWNSDDFASGGSSGSIQVDTHLTGIGISSCFRVVEGAPYSQGGDLKLATASNASASFQCNVFSDASCTNTIQTLSIEAAPGAAWSAMTPSNGTLPAGAQSASCSVVASPSLGVTSVRFDNLFLNSEAPSTPVTLQSFFVR